MLKKQHAYCTLSYMTTYIQMKRVDKEMSTLEQYVTTLLKLFVLACFRGIHID